MVVARFLLIVLAALVFCQTLGKRSSSYFAELETDHDSNASVSATLEQGSLHAGDIEQSLEEREHDEARKKGNTTKKLLLVLFKSLACIVLGATCKYYGWIVPEKGHMHALGFFVGKIALPLLVYKVIALTSLGDIDFRLILACNLAKVIVLVVTFAVTYVAYERHRKKGQRMLTSTIFGFFAIASNDFALGFPVINSLYGPSMEVYLSANALVGQAVLQPVVMVLLGIGKSMKASEDEEGSSAEGGRALQTVKDIALNPIVLASMLGLLSNVMGFKRFMLDGTGNPFLAVIDIFTAPFVTLALFLTGVSLRSPKITTWSCLLVIMKVVVCAYVSYMLAILLGKGMSSDGKGMPSDLQDFSFFYGSIPTSSAPLVFAGEFDPSAVELVATSILLGLCAAGPNMMVTSLFLGGDGENRTETLDSIVTLVVRMSFLAGVVLMYIHGMSFWRNLHWSLAKRSIGVYGIVAMLYTVWMGKLSNEHFKCTYVNAAHFACKQRIIFNTLQKALVLIVFYLQYNLSKGWAHRTQELRASLWRVLLLGVIAVFVGIFTGPFTLPMLCNQADKLNFWQKIAFPITSGCCLLCTIVLAVQDFRARVAANSSPSPESAPAVEISLTATDNKDTARGESEPDLHVAPDTQEHAEVENHDSAFTIRTLFRLQGLRILLQVVNSWSAFAGKRAQGVFTQMLIIESILEHSQLAVLLLAILFDISYRRIIECGMVFNGQTTLSDKMLSIVSESADLVKDTPAK